MASQFKIYSLGFLFCLDERDNLYVLLMHKKKPEWQRGKVNGIGGKLEEGEEIHDCMIREFKEKTGIIIPVWDFFCEMRFILQREKVFCYSAEWHNSFTDLQDCVKKYNIGIGSPSHWKKDIEFLYLCHVSSLSKNVIPNLNWLIPMARHSPEPTVVLF